MPHAYPSLQARFLATDILPQTTIRIQDKRVIQKHFKILSGEADEEIAAIKTVLLETALKIGVLLSVK